MFTENSSRRQQRHIHKALLGKCRSHCHTAVLASHVVALFGGLVVVVDVWVAIYYLIMTLAFIHNEQDSRIRGYLYNAENL